MKIYQSTTCNHVINVNQNEISFINVLASLFSVMIEFKNERIFMNFLLSIRIIPVGGYTYNSLY